MQVQRGRILESETNGALPCDLATFCVAVVVAFLAASSFFLRSSHPSWVESWVQPVPHYVPQLD